MMKKKTNKTNAVVGLSETNQTVIPINVFRNCVRNIKACDVLIH